MATNYSDPKYAQRTLNTADLQSRGYLPDEIAARQSNVDKANVANAARLASRQQRDASLASPEGMPRAAPRVQGMPRHGTSPDQMNGVRPTGPSMNSMYSKLGAPGASPEDKQALMGAIATKNTANQALPPPGMKQGGKVKKYAKGGSVSSASSRADGCCTKGKTKGKYL
jgi:hypothetical protein